MITKSNVSTYRSMAQQTEPLLIETEGDHTTVQLFRAERTETDALGRTWYEYDYHEFSFDGDEVNLDDVRAAPESFMDFPAAEPDPVAALQAQNRLLTEQNEALAQNQEFLEDCLMEMAELVYA